MLHLKETEPDTLYREKQASTKKSTVVSIVVNIILSVVQVLVGFFSASQGLIADGMHSASDFISDGIVLMAVHYSNKGPDEDHHYGHHRYENVASMVLGALLLAVGLGMIWMAVQKLQNPSAISIVHSIALYTALGGLISKELLFRYMLAAAKHARSTLLIANAWHARSDAASSLVVSVAIIGNMYGFRLLDPIAAVIVGAMITKMGGGFFLEALNDLSDRAASAEQIKQILEEIKATPGVMGVHDVKSRITGDFILLDVHLEIDGEQSVREGHSIAVEARRRVMDKFPVLNVMTHVDPV